MGSLGRGPSGGPPPGRQSEDASDPIGDLTVFQNVELPLTYRGGLGAAEQKRRVTAALDRTIHRFDGRIVDEEGHAPTHGVAATS